MASRAWAGSGELGGDRRTSGLQPPFVVVVWRHRSSGWFAEELSRLEPKELFPVHMPSSPSSSDLNSMEIVNTRLFAHPRAVLYEAFADPEQLAQWWGPRGFTNRIEGFDLRAGGAWRVVMQSPDGTTYENEWEFIETVRPARIVMVHLRPGHRFQLKMSYEDLSDATRLSWQMKLEAHPDNEKLEGIIRTANEQNFDRLASHLERWRNGTPEQR